MPSIARILQLAPLSAALSADDIANGALFGPKLDPTNPIKIYNVYKVLKRIYDLDPNYEGLQERCDYLYELLKKYALRAAAIIDGGGGGSVAPITPTTRPEPYDFEISGSSFISTGESTKQFPLSWQGWDILFVRNSIPQSTVVNLVITYYSWDSDTRTLTLFGPAPGNGEAQETELFQIYPI